MPRTPNAARLAEIDLLKSLAILAVVVIHALRPPWDVGATPADRMIGHLTRFGVPAFLFSSGFLYARQARGLGSIRIRLERLMLPYLVASCAAQVFWRVQGLNPSGGSLVHDLALGASFGQYYYVFVLFFLVLASPLFEMLPAMAIALAFSVFFAMQGLTVAGVRGDLGLFWLLRDPFQWWAQFLLGWLVAQHYARSNSESGTLGVSAESQTCLCDSSGGLVTPRILGCFFALVLSLVQLPEAGARDFLDGSETKRYSQFDEELIIRDFFQDKRGGVFVDVGCSYPIAGSTTYFLEKHLGWSGIAVDALPEYAPEWQKERPRSKFFSFYVSDRSDTDQVFYRSAVKGLSSSEQGRVFKGLQIPQEEIHVPTVTLTKLLDANGTGEIDLLSMDIEGAEPAALAGFEIARFKPKLVCIEAAPRTRKQILDYFQAHGYERIERYLKYDNVNWYFRPVPKPE
jgi:FkbM family methyltransferase